MNVVNALLNGEPLSGPIALAEIRALWAEEVVYQVLVEQVTGGPSAAALGCKFEQYMSVSAAQTVDTWPGGTWTPIDADANGGLIPDGDWPTKLADQTSTQRVVTDGVTTSGAYTVTSATATFVAGDVGAQLRAASIPQGARILTVDSGTQVTLDQPAISSSTGLNVTIYKPLMFTRRIRGGVIHRLVFDKVTFTGGTAPTFVVSVSCVARG